MGAVQKEAGLLCNMGVTPEGGAVDAEEHDNQRWITSSGFNQSFSQFLAATCSMIWDFDDGEWGH